MGKRGPKPLPANVHQLRGNPSKLPAARFSDGVQPPVEIPNCPPHLQPDAKKEWKRIAIELEALGLITKIDRAALAAYCSAWAEMVFCEQKISELNGNDPSGVAGLVTVTPSGYSQMSVWTQIRNRAADRMMKFGAEFGMSPSSRSRVTPSDNQPMLPGFEKSEAKATGWAAL